MSAETTYFSGTTLLENYSEVLAYLQANAADYFTGIEGSSTSSNAITLKAGDKAKISMDFYAGNFYKDNGFSVTLENGKNYTYVLATIEKAIKTSCGVMLFLRRPDGEYYGTHTITKNNKGDTVLISDTFINATASNQNRMQLQMYDFLNSPDVTRYATEGEGFASWCSTASVPTGHTTPVTLCFKGGTYTENVVLLAFNNLNNVECRVDIDGTKYVYDGVVALKE